MKATSVFFLSIIFLSGCSSPENTEVDDLKCPCEDSIFSESADTDSIVGVWKWVASWEPLPLSETNPITPEKAGINEYLFFCSDKKWYKYENKMLTDSGTYSLGHGYSTNICNHTFIYDSICYYQNNIPVNNGVDYYQIYGGDTLCFFAYFAGKIHSYTLKTPGSKYWVRKK